MHEHPATDSPTPPAPAAGGGQVDDINIPLVAVSVALFAVTLAVLIVALQAVFKNADARETQGKTLAQEDVRTDLGKLLAAQRAELHVGLNPQRLAAPGTAPTSASAPATASASAPARKWIPIDTAMQVVAREYHGSGGGAQQ